ncbi:MAG: GNAT family N-acetyltransferase [Roseibium sp.]
MTEINPQKFRITSGFPENQRREAAGLFWQAFSEKLDQVLGPETKAVSLIERLLDPGYAISAMAQDGKLLGLAGYKTSEGALVAGSLRDIASVYGVIGGLWRGVLLDLLERDPEPEVLLMDGIFVSADARGLGIGAGLLDAICQKAKGDGFTRVRLDVIDTNPRARALYERCGFEPVQTADIGLLKALFGFSSATRMEKVVSPA